VETEAEAQARVRDLIKELRDAQGLSYKELAARLAALGEDFDARALNNRINRGSFSAGFLVLLLQALDAPLLEVTDAPKRLRAKPR
jgi:transcriptional regulator with XRE-family HTH domain